jgi:hypothetical protein
MNMLHIFLCLAVAESGESYRTEASLIIHHHQFTLLQFLSVIYYSFFILLY